MRITFITNYMTPHQRPFCEAMYALMKEDFHFISTTIMENERKDMGWSSDIKDLPYASFYDGLILKLLYRITQERYGFLK